MRACLQVLVLSCAAWLLWSCAEELADDKSACDTGNGWLRYYSSCIKKMEGHNGWQGARHHCVWEGGDLIAGSVWHNYNFFVNLMDGWPFWIGYSNLKCNKTWCQYKGDKTLTWSDPHATERAYNWDNDQLPKMSNVEACVYIKLDRKSPKVNWRHGPCGSSFAYVCERPPDACQIGRPCSYQDHGFDYHRVETSYCDARGLLYKDSCYYFEGNGYGYARDAERLCQRRNGHLASVHSQEEGKFLHYHWLWEDNSVFVGLFEEDSICSWTDGSSTDDIPWAKEEERRLFGCAALESDGRIYLGCQYSSGHICKIAKARSTLNLRWTPPPAVWSAKCGWWREHPSNAFCYLIKDASAKTWQEARDDCVRLSGDLLSTTDKAEHDFVRVLLPTGPSLWLAPNVIVAEDGGNQTDEAPLTTVQPKTTTTAAPTQPPGCPSLLTSKGNQSSVDCQKKSGYVCKRRADWEPTCDTANGWRLYGSICYKKMAPNGWLGARHHCVWEGGHLISIDSEEEQNFLWKQMGDRPFWIGLSNLKCDKAWCQYEGGKTLTWPDTRVKMTFTNWAKGQSGSSDVEACAYANQGLNKESQNGKWRHGQCGSSLAYVCERSADDCPEGRPCFYKDYGFGYDRVETSYCSPGDLLYNDSCYHFEKAQSTWKEAEEFCKRWKGHLASVHSRDEAKFLRDHLGFGSGWVGVRKTADNSDWSWSDGSGMDYKSWISGQQDVDGDCGLLSDVHLLDFPCISSRSFVCKKAKVRESLLEPPGWSATCGWWRENPSNDFCYLIQRRPTKTWQEARDDCGRLGGDLLSLADLHEQTFVHGLYTFLPSAPSLWLGANVTEEGSEWTDRSPFGYVLMDQSPPGDLPGKRPGKRPDKRCLSLLTSNGRWEFDDCSKKRGYICKKRGNPAEPPRPHAGLKEIVVCEDKDDFLLCENDRVIRIQSAFYGRRSGDVCPAEGESDGRCTVEGSLARYRKNCDNHRKCHLEHLEAESCSNVFAYLEMVYSCEHKVCLDRLGIVNGSIVDLEFKASSSLATASPEKARLNGKSCWKPLGKALGSWIQVNLGQMRKVTGIVSQGCPHTHPNFWGIQLEMQLSADGSTWTEIPDGKFIAGETQLLGTPTSAQYVRILPLENGRKFGLRFDILGCALDDSMTCGSKFNSLHFTDWMRFQCPPGCAKAIESVFGTYVYKEDSNVCAAAIHAGVVGKETGGESIVMRAPEQKRYTGSTNNGITSKPYDGPAALAFAFADGEPRCSGPDWWEFAGSCYKHFEGQKSWAEAQDTCKSLGANLVSVRSKLERAWVEKASNLDRGDMWTGLNDLALPGTLVWSDRHEVTFTRWAKGEPNNRAGLDKHCVAMSSGDGRWKQMSCTQVNRFMCKKPTERHAVTSVKPQVAQSSQTGDSTSSDKPAKSIFTVREMEISGIEAKMKEGLRVNSNIIITAQANQAAEQFTVSLGIPGNFVTVLKVDLSFKTKMIALDSGQQKSLSQTDFGPGLDFEVAIRCDADAFHVSVNGVRMLTRQHQVEDLADVTRLHVQGQVWLKDVKL